MLYQTDMRARAVASLLAAALALSSSCDRGTAPDTASPAARTSGKSARLDRFERNAEHDDRRIDRLADEAAKLTADVQQIASLFKQANRDYERATRALNRAAERFEAASEEYQNAAEAQRRAAKYWRVVAVTIMVAAASDMAERSLCDGQMNNTEIRKYWKSKGYDLDGIDADHIWPKSKGGANHPWNFQRMESSLNRSLGNDIWWKLQNQPIALLQGAAVSALVHLQCR